MDLRGRAAVVIGGASGIGRGIALALAERGADVLVADRDAERAEQVAEELAARGVRARAHATDATDPASLEETADAAWRAFGAVHVLSNNAGVVHLRPLLEATALDWQWVIEANLMSIVHGGAIFGRRLVDQAQGGHVVNTASLAGLVAGAMPSLGLYTATKHAVVGYSETLLGELAPHGIGVSVLCPGMVRSRLGSTSAAGRPERFGGPLPSALGDDEMPDFPGMISAELCGRLTVRAIEADRFLVATHPETRGVVEARHARYLADFEAGAVARREEEAS